MNMRLFAVLIVLGTIVGTACASPTKSVIGARHNAFMETEEAEIPYVKDGLVFIKEGFETPDVAWSMAIGTDVPAIEWTMEWCGIHEDNKRNNCFMSCSKKPTTASSFNFSIGWWINNDGMHINQRYYYGETNSGQTIGTIAQLAYTVTLGSVIDMYADGVHYGQNSSLVATAITSQIGDPIRYIGSGAGDKVMVYSVRIYNRALTVEEIAYNAQIDRERFGE